MKRSSSIFAAALTVLAMASCNSGGSESRVYQLPSSIEVRKGTDVTLTEYIWSDDLSFYKMKCSFNNVPLWEDKTIVTDQTALTVTRDREYFDGGGKSHISTCVKSYSEKGHLLTSIETTTGGSVVERESYTYDESWALTGYEHVVTGVSTERRSDYESTYTTITYTAVIEKEGGEPVTRSVKTTYTNADKKYPNEEEITVDGKVVERTEYYHVTPFQKLLGKRYIPSPEPGKKDILVADYEEYKMEGLTTSYTLINYDDEGKKTYVKETCISKTVTVKY